MMQQVVNAGTGTAAALTGIQVAGKTGTAQRGASNVAWFIAFAPANDPKVAVAVTIENTLVHRRRRGGAARRPGHQGRFGAARACREPGRTRRGSVVT